MSTQPTDDEILAMASNYWSHWDEADRETGIELVRDALARWGTPATGGEPVAYLIDWPDEPELGHYFAETPTQSGRSQPLYTSPQPVREPTDAQVWAAAKVMSPSLFRHGLSPHPKDGPKTTEIMKKETALVRAMLNAAHGITGGQHGTE